jgi:hypothetical protein
VFCRGVGWFKKSSRYGVTQHDAPESMSACVNYCVEVLVAINITIFLTVLCFYHVFLFEEVVPYGHHWLHQVCTLLVC